MLELVKEFISECKSNPKEMLLESATVFLMFASFYLIIVLGSILGLQ
jgi:hypothetical protein